MWAAYFDLARAVPDRGVSISDANAWFDMYGIEDRQWWWQMFSELDRARLSSNETK